MIFLRLAFAALLMVPTAQADELSDPFSSKIIGELLDAGAFFVSSSALPRREDFKIFRRPDGGRTLTSVTTASDGSYHVSGRWDYDQEGRALSAHGKGTHDGESVQIALLASQPAAIMRIAGSNGGIRTFHALCEDCLIDMSPSAAAMFTMTRLYDMDGAVIQDFRWIGYSLTRDQRLFDGTVKIRFVDQVTVKREGEIIPIRHFVFDEKLVDENSGKAFEVHFNLWADLEHRPIKFQTGKTTVGIREGYESISASLVPK